jgi:hypothetical protein
MPDREGEEMGGAKRLSEQSFLFLAREAGLETDDPHMMEKLYPYVQEVLPKLKGAETTPAEKQEGKDLSTFINRYMPQLKRLDELDLAGLDPAMVFKPAERDRRE